MGLTAADSGVSNGGVGDGVVHKPRSLRSPWAQVVRGETEPSPPSPPPPPLTWGGEQSSFSDSSPPPSMASPSPVENSAVVEGGSDANDGGGGNVSVGKPKKGAWNKPSNGVAEVTPVMDAVSWPALSGSTKLSPKSSSAESSSSKTGAADRSMPSHQEPLIPVPSNKQAAGNAKSNSTPNHTMHRQRSMKHRGGGGGNGYGGGHSHGSFTHPSLPPPPPPFPVFQMQPNGYGNLVPFIADQSLRVPSYRGNRPVGGFGYQTPVNDNRHSSRRGNFGARGREQDRGHHGNVRDGRMQPQRAPPTGFVRTPPPNTTAFIPLPMRPINFPLIFSPTPIEPFRPVPLMTPLPTHQMIEYYLPARLLHQIEYYFSDANLIKDEYLKSNMDDQGWVPITLIAGFNRVKSMTNDLQLIVESLRPSAVLEVQDDKVRRRNDWIKWIRSSSRLPDDSGLQSSNITSYEMLTNSFQKIAVDETATDQDSMTVKSSPHAENVPGDFHQS